ncbi:protein phosphatase 1H-like [Carcharodon carcharias]|uniref:protein phosphatase 1H-like n=1 Tax=Carcharodon carcharias TaxID=13397 RepID=UPI001B7DEFD5|nr:protein phosphatase 1H-like [Carcharodon carcharias]
MISRVKAAVAQLVGGTASSFSPGSCPESSLKSKYSRPAFLFLSPEESERAADHSSRPILVPGQDRRKRRKLLPWDTGYAEVINAGKSVLNEDQAARETVCVEKGDRKNSTEAKTVKCDGRAHKERDGLQFHYWALFDGHAGTDAAVMAAKLLHLHICEQLRGIVDILRDGDVPPPICLTSNDGAAMGTGAKSPQHQGDWEPPTDSESRFLLEKEISHEYLVIGAIENAFRQMDQQIEREQSSRGMLGGCCALAVVYLLEKIYIANAGDSRAILIRNGEAIPLSSEFTPESERQRLQYLGYLQPHLLGNEFTHLEFPRRIQHREIGRKMLFRDYSMTGWAYKTIEEDDLKFPLVYGEGKKARVMATIGVTRGLGDHNLKVHCSDIHIKPFLSCVPEVKVYDVTKHEHGVNDVIVLGTDGLWDVVSDREVADAVIGVLSDCEPDDPNRFTLAAQDLVMKSRGILREHGWWKSDDRLGSGDDISVFVIPLYGHT